MDFWSRIIAGTSLSSSSDNKGSANNPDKRLARFQREYRQLLQIWKNVTNFSRDPDAAEDIRGCIQELTSILSDETRRPSPHLCISFAAAKQIYVPIGKIAITSYDEPIIREAVAFFTTLIESEEEDFLESDTFSRSLMTLLVRITGANSIRLSSETEVEVVELAFGIAAKIRLQPEILSAWFTTRGDQSEEANQGLEDAHEKFAGKTQKEDFPLFYLLIDYIHQEGRIGDFARTGLLYIIESASTSVALEQWLVESDLATLMATGLGALYSQLSRKLVIDHPKDELPAILALSDYRHPVTSREIVSSASSDFQNHMETFLSHLVFWQDVLEHCKSVEVKQTLLEHFQIIFLQQLLYPSLLESSDIDGGSSVAVLTYLRRILESLDHPDMIHLILHYLLALPDTTPVRTSGSRASVSAARKRKSMDLAKMMAAQVEMQSTPSLFNLVDLIQGSLRSQSQQTIAVTLQLVSVILRRHHRYAVSTLLRIGRVLVGGPQRTIGAHETEMEFLLTLAGDIGGDENFESVYENHVKDSMALLESHLCSQTLIAPKAPSGPTRLPGAQASIPGGPREVRPHTLRADDPLLKTMLSILETFFVNPIETNLCLTEAIFDLAACGFMSIDGWLLPDPSNYTYPDDEDEDMTVSVLFASGSLVSQEASQLRAIRRARLRPAWPPSNLPSLLLILQTLVAQVASYRNTIPRFEDLLAQRRHAFQSVSASPAPKPRDQTSTSAPRSSFDSSTGSRSVSPPREKQSAFDSLAQRIFPDLATPSRSNSPRGRRSQDQPRAGGYGIGTPTSTPIPRSGPPPPQFPMGSALETPSRGSSRAFSPSPLRAGEGAVKPGLSGQEAAFREVERGLLARRVGVPGWKEAEKRRCGVVPFPDLKRGGEGSTQDDEGDGNGSPKGESTEAGEGDEEVEEEEKMASVSHVLTNVVVLQDFLLEMAALVQVRAGLFGEVRFG